jgi:hypothetical protein
MGREQSTKLSSGITQTRQSRTFLQQKAMVGTWLVDAQPEYTGTEGGLMPEELMEVIIEGTAAEDWIGLGFYGSSTVS